MKQEKKDNINVMGGDEGRVNTLDGVDQNAVYQYFE